MNSPSLKIWHRVTHVPLYLSCNSAIIVHTLLPPRIQMSVCCFPLSKPGWKTSEMVNCDFGHMFIHFNFAVPRIYDFLSSSCKSNTQDCWHEPGFFSPLWMGRCFKIDKTKICHMCFQCPPFVSILIRELHHKVRDIVPGWRLPTHTCYEDGVAAMLVRTDGLRGHRGV